MKNISFIFTLVFLLNTRNPLFSQRCTPLIPIVGPSAKSGHFISSSVYSFNKNRLANLNNSVNESVLVMTINKTSSNGQYVYSVSSGATDLVYEGKSYSDLVKRIKTKNVTKKEIYLDLDGFTKNDELALQTNISQAKSDSRITTWRREATSIELQDKYLGKLTEANNISISESTFVVKGNKYHKAITGFFFSGKKYIVEVISSSKKIVTDFYTLLRKKLGAINPRSYSSLADVISEVKSDIIKSHAITEKDILVKFKHEEFDNTLIVEVPHINTSVLAV